MGGDSAIQAISLLNAEILGIFDMIAFF